MARQMFLRRKGHLGPQFGPWEHPSRLGAVDPIELAKYPWLSQVYEKR